MVTCTSFTNFLDLECIFVNIFSGNIVLFGILAAILIFSFAAKLRMTLIIAIGFMALFIIFFPAYGTPILILLGFIIVIFIIVWVIRAISGR